MDFTSPLKKLKDIPPASRICNLSGSSMALFLALQEKPFIMVESTAEAARELHEDILFFKSIINEHFSHPPPHPLPSMEGGLLSSLFPCGGGASVFFLPEPDGPEICGERADVIYRFKEGDSIVTSKDALKTAVWSKDKLKEKTLNLKAHLEIGREMLEQMLIGLGYKRVPIVVESGEFSRREWLFDIFPSTLTDPIRVEFFGDQIETIKTFDINTQKSIKSIEEFVLLPSTEMGDGAHLFSIVGDIKCFCSDSVSDLPECTTNLSRFHFEGARFHFKGEGIDAGLLSMGGYGIYHDERKSIYEFPDAIKKVVKDNRVIIVAASRGQAERIKDVLVNSDVIAPVIAKEDISEYGGNILITIGELSSGFFIQGLMFLTEKEIFGGRPEFRPIKKSKVSDLLLTIDDLAIGDYIVHRDHGIGRFVGLEKQDVEGYKGDLMVLEYSGGDRLYLPVYGIGMIKKYHAEDGVIPKIDRLGGKTWEKIKERVRKKIKEMAGRLLKIYAEREISKGFAFSEDTELHREFDDFFFYEETPDQSRATGEIKLDMESNSPMDRLLCGDVGYGKTEVAMKAAFKAVYDGRQVAVLVPTTLLCEQHYRTFRQRFSAFPVSVDFLSRFKSKDEQAKTIKMAADGDVDILIGTHALLRRDIGFHNLGLLIIDEEHRFGVAQKERIKELKKGVDVLTLTATPIPRTLNMALSGIRGMSLIETPPEERLAVKSIVTVFDGKIIKDAIEREVSRRGQIYFVHNHINDIEKIFNFVRRLVPEARMAIAHGQMNERELEKIMKRFIDGEIDVLVSTAIVGSGLDIPNANTIIINRADRMGLADLYQLKGRVGRSNVRAYAFFLIPGEDIITDEAKKRLHAIQDMSYLGAGFRLAMRDMEIRGTGNLLGSEQSGHIHAVGFDMYLEMLEKAVAELKGIKIEEEIDPRISLRISAYIPEEFVDDVTLRLSIYRKIASARSPEGLDAIGVELEDRFGRMPLEVRNLLDVMNLKILARILFITDIKEIGNNIRIIFSKDTKVSVERILGLRGIVNRKIRFFPDGFEIDVKGLTWESIYDAIKETLERLI